MLAVTTSSCPSSENGALQGLEDPLGQVEHIVAVSMTSSMRMMNSSPPSRATVSAVANAALQPPADRDQELIAHLVTQAVVDELETVDVEEEDTEPSNQAAASSVRRPGPDGPGEVRGWADR